MSQFGQLHVFEIRIMHLNASSFELADDEKIVCSKAFQNIITPS